MRHYTMEQTCAALHVNPRTLRNWMEEQGIQWGFDPADKRVRRITEEELHRLAGHYGRLVREPMSQEDLYARIAELEAEVARYEAMFGRDQRLNQIEDLSVRLDKVMNGTKGPFTRLVERHGVNPKTARGWQWPEYARQSVEASLLYARTSMGGETPRNWHECDLPECPCHSVDALRNSARRPEPGA